MKKLITGLDYQITDSDLHEISSAHCETWRSLPQYLELPNTIVGDIEQSYTDEDERRIEFFKVWKNKNGPKATYKNLIDALDTVQCREDKDSIVQLLLRAPSPIHLSQQTGVTSLSHDGKHGSTYSQLLKSIV